ncbi:MAG: hypothetical protein VYA20_01590 [Candidatus Neomarinimicrobiota bacterium]|nr:hypothetical protein [Candidatus Neomarinimicrobiota bacterium]
MKINKKLFIQLSVLLVFISCSSNNQFIEIDYSKNANLTTMEKQFYKSSGSGKLIAKGKNNFVSYFDFISTENSSSIVFRDFLRRKQFLVEIVDKDIRYHDIKNRSDVDIRSFNNFFPIATKMDANTYKKLMWGIPDAFNEIDLITKKEFSVSTKLISVDDRNLINELIFSFNNNKQEYKLLFLDRKFLNKE